MSWSFVARNRRHVHFDVEPVRTPVLCEVSLAAGRDLNSRDSLSRVLTTGVEGATRVMSFIILTIVDLYNVCHNNQLE
jgi:hypothetical protein